MRTLTFKHGLIITLLVFVTGCGKDDKINDAEIIQTSYPKNAKIDNISSFGGDKEYIISEYEYDAQGGILKVSTPGYDYGKPTGEITQYDLYKYDNNNRLDRIENYNWNITDQDYWNLRSTVFTYNNTGEKIKETTIYPKIGSADYRLFYYKNRQLIKAEMYNNKNQLTYITEYSYDPEEKLIKEIAYTSDKTPIRETEHSYKDGMNIKTMVYILSDRGKEELRRITRQFDQNKNLIILKSEELSLLSSAVSYAVKYQYLPN